MWGTERKCPLTLWLLSLLTVRIIVIQLSFDGIIINIQGKFYALSFRVLKDLLRSLKALGMNCLTQKSISFDFDKHFSLSCIPLRAQFLRRF